MNIVVVCGMSDEKVRARLEPITAINEVEQIYLIRRQPFTMAKVKTYSPPNWMQNILVIAEMYRFLTLCLICVTENPEVIYGIYFVPHGIYAAIAGWIFRKRVIQELIGTDRPKVMKSRLLLSVLHTAEHIGVRGSISRDQLIGLRIPENKLFTPIAANALDFQKFKPLNLFKKFDLIYCGRMDENKQVDIILKAAANLKETKPDLSVVLVGDGPERGNLERLTKQLNLEANITFVGNQPYHQIPMYLNLSRIFVMASAFEGLPVAMLEALSCGLPVVVPDVGDILDIAQDGKNAVIVKEHNSKSYAEALAEILENPDLWAKLHIGALESRENLLENYSSKKSKLIWKSILLNSQA